ncbi:MAG: SDR family oxidoreductase [Myxococcales bacterium]|nr:SDR family oxidoreductase [Myxococcales bacterium]
MGIDDGRLDGKVVWVTGAGRGLGRALALAMSRAGARVAAMSRTAGDLEDLAAKAPGEVLWGAVDVREAEAVAAFAGRIIDAWGRLDAVVSNAGIGRYGDFLDQSYAELGLVVDVNLKGPMFVAHAALPHLLAGGGGHLVHIASDLARRPLAKMAPYAATKHGLLGFSASLLQEFKGRGLKVTTVNPGIIDTGFGDSQPDSRDESWALRPAALADVVLHVLTQPGSVVIDEITVHPLGQDF